MLKRNVFTNGLSQKLQPKFIGPFKVTRQIDRLRYRAKNLTENAKRKFQTVHIERLKVLGKDLLEDSDDIELSSSPLSQPLTQVKKPLVPKKKRVAVPKSIVPTSPPKTTYTSRFGRVSSKPNSYAK